MKIPFNKKWLLSEREDYANYLFVVAAWEGYTHLPRKWNFPAGKFLGAEYINTACNLFVLKDGNDKNNAINFQALFTKPNLWDNLHKMTNGNSKKLFRWAGKIRKLEAKNLSNTKLLNLIDTFNGHQASVHCPRGPMWCLETPDNIVTNYLHNYLTERAADKGKGIRTKPLEAFQILTASLKKSVWAEERDDLAKIGLIRNKVLRDRKLLKHAKEYEWIEYGLQGRILDLNYFGKELTKIMRGGTNKVLRSYQKEIKSLAKKQKKIIKEYGIHPKHQKIFQIVRDANHIRIYSKNSQIFGYYCLENILKEIGKRAGLTLEQVRFLAPQDYKKILLEGKDFSKITRERRKYSLHISNQGKTDFFYGGKAREIKRKMKFFQVETTAKNSEMITGQPAYSGKAKGRVKIINKVQEMVKMHAGNVLVSHMTNPDIVPVMKQAVAIVTDLGGITSHAAIVARELKKPCIIGTKIATRVLKDGDLVEVDAIKGVVRKI